MSSYPSRRNAYPYYSDERSEANASNMSLNDRVAKIHGKISKIQSQIQQSRSYKLEEYEAKVSQLEDQFDSVID